MDVRLLTVWLAVAAGCASESGKDTAGDAALGSDSIRARPSSPTATTHDGRPVALLVGTSLTAGMGLDPDDAYPALLQRKADSAGLAIRIVGAGLSGETSAGALRRVDWLLAEPPQFVLIETGANDGLRGLNVDSTRANLRAILRRVKAAAPGAIVLLAQMESPPNFGAAYTSRFREMFPTVAREEGAVLVPFLLDGVAGVPSMNQSDGIHPNEEGSRLVAENLWRTLEPVFRRN